MKKLLTLIILSFLFLVHIVAQNAQQSSTSRTEVGAANPEEIGVDKAQQELKEVSISKFEDDGLWKSYMRLEDGLIHLRRFNGSPLEKQPILGEQQAGIKEDDIYVLGAKVEHLHRAVTSFEVMPSTPLPVPGITKTISLWVIGRNVNHQLYIYVRDYFNNLAKIHMGSLAFTGWKKLTASVPPNIRQVDPRYSNRQGIQIFKLAIETDPVETYGSYYIYFDDLRVVTDLFSEKSRDQDDMSDSW